MYRKVMIIDDDEVSSFLTEAALIEEGIADSYESFLCSKKALSSLLPALRGQQTAPLPDLILLDLNMPLINGWDFLEALAPYAPQLQAQCRIYILTSSVDEKEMARAGQNRLVSGFLHKPLMDEGILQLKQGG